jgi:hypothetical protein
MGVTTLWCYSHFYVEQDTAGFCSYNFLFNLYSCENPAGTKKW